MAAAGITDLAGDGTPAVPLDQSSPLSAVAPISHATMVMGMTPVVEHGSHRVSCLPVENTTPVQRAGLQHHCQAAANLRPPVPCRHLRSAMLRHVADAAYVRLLEASGADRVRLRSSAGPTAGTSFVAPLSFAGIHYTDEEWEGALRRRLGLRAVGTQQPHGVLYCRNWNQSKQQPCGAVLDDVGSHAAICPCGPLTNLCHDALADRWCDIIEDTSACTRRELYVPSLSTPDQDAWLDIGTFGTGPLGQQLFDITVRHPGAARYVDAAADTDGAAAA